MCPSRPGHLVAAEPLAEVLTSFVICFHIHKIMEITIHSTYLQPYCEGEIR